MALKGSMRDFGISEILQLIGHQKKSGALVVRDPSRKVEILFDQGNIVSANHDPYEESFDLGALLYRSGHINQTQFESARQMQKQTLKPFEQILLQSNAVSIDDLKSMKTLANLEAIYSIFLWKGGNYSFEAGPINYPQQWTDPISSEQVLMDGYRIKDEWPLLEKTIPDLRVRLEKTSFGEAPNLVAEQAAVYQLVNGKRTVEDIIFMSRMGKFEAMKEIRRLIDAGKIRTSEVVEEQPAVGAGQAVFKGMAVFALLLALAAILTGAGGFLTPMLVAEGEGAPRAALWSLYQEDRVQSALEVYFAFRGSYPASLSELVSEGFLNEDDLVTPLGELRYQIDREGQLMRLWVEEGGPPAAADGSPGGG